MWSICRTISSPSIWQALNVILDPFLAPIRRIMPDTGMIDFSPMVLIVGCDRADAARWALAMIFAIGGACERRHIIDGKAFAAGLRARIADSGAAFDARSGRKAGLAVVLVGEDPASQVYVRSKGKATVDAAWTALNIACPPIPHRPICSRWSTAQRR